MPPKPKEDPCKTKIFHSLILLKSRDEQKASLLALPEELLSYILQELLISKGPLMRRLNRSGEARLVPGTVESYDLHPAILRTRRSLYSEGRKLLYGRNILCLELHYPYNRWPGSVYRQNELVTPTVWIPAFEKAPLAERRTTLNPFTTKMEIILCAEDFALLFLKLKIEVPTTYSGLFSLNMEETLPLMQPILKGRYLEAVRKMNKEVGISKG